MNHLLVNSIITKTNGDVDMAWDGRYETSYYKTEDLVEDLKNYIEYGIVSARELPGGGVEVMEERSDGTARLNAYFPKELGKHSHYWVDSNGKKYFRK